MKNKIQIMFISIGGIFVMMNYINENPIITLLGFLWFGILGLMVAFLPSFVSHRIEKNIECIDLRLQRFIEESWIDHNYDEILKISSDGYKIMCSTGLLRFFYYITRSNTLKDKLLVFSSYLENSIISNLRILKNELHADMEKSIASLLYTKENIRDTDWWNVWKYNENILLIEARLDRQIEQFEELQRTLVRV